MGVSAPPTFRQSISSPGFLTPILSCFYSRMGRLKVSVAPLIEMERGTSSPTGAFMGTWKLI